jgi:sugar-specific transcriptional regulator TrmB
VQDRPTYDELLEAVQTFLETDVVPALEGPKKFHARVAANVLAIVRRELRSADAQYRTEWERLDRLLGAAEPPPVDGVELRERLRARTEDLCERIRRGEADTLPWRAAVLAHIRQTVIEKLAVANPKYLGADVSTTPD